jgi:predicted DNA-binding protein (MmcQ/YjbR family)
MGIDDVRKLAFSFPETTEEPHFEKTSFRVKKKIYATYGAEDNQVVVKLNLTDQDVFCSGSSRSIFPVPNKWGKQGWTGIALDTVHPDLLCDALTTAYCTVAPRKLSLQVRP